MWRETSSHGFVGRTVAAAHLEDGTITAFTHAHAAMTAGSLTFGPIQEVEDLRLLNETTLPVRYNEKFYAEVLTLRPEHAKYGACAVGGDACALRPLLSMDALTSSSPSSFFFHLHA